jgi:hypothetical protein
MADSLRRTTSLQGRKNVLAFDASFSDDPRGSRCRHGQQGSPFCIKGLVENFKDGSCSAPVVVAPWRCRIAMRLNGCLPNSSSNIRRFECLCNIAEIMCKGPCRAVLARRKLSKKATYRPGTKSEYRCSPGDGDTHYVEEDQKGGQERTGPHRLRPATLQCHGTQANIGEQRQ